MQQKILLTITLGLIIAGSTGAHGLVTTQQQTVGSYLIEFEYNTLGNITAGDYMLYTVRLLDFKTNEPVPFDSAFVRIDEKDGPAILAGNLTQALQIGGLGASINGIMPKAGTYAVEVRFQKNDKELAIGNFSFGVDPAYQPAGTGQAKSKNQNYITIALSVICGIIIGMLADKFLR
ncbi:MAG TPA: hypothetical protein VGQ87_02190 [Patescibacteria group bacterium]|jgi:hypothetical protein|nr:hypothetical protein [Patescibacteria group bacterium]